MITSHLGGVFLGSYVQNGGKRVKPKQKIANCFDVDDVDINLYVFWDAEAKCDVNGEVRCDANVVAVKVKVMLTK